MSEQTQAERLAEVLEGHQMRGGIFLRDGKWMVRCKCGEYLTEAGFYPAQDIALAAHQAAVILAHLTAEGWAQINAPKGPVHPQLRAAKWPTRREPVE